MLGPKELSPAQAGHSYEMRWGCEGSFRAYERAVGKVKLLGRTAREVHREAEGSLLAVRSLLAQGGRPRLLYGHERERGSGRESLLEVRREIRDHLAGKRGRMRLQRRLAEALRRGRKRRRPEVRRVWPTRGSHESPKPPDLRVLSAERNALPHKISKAA